jgi:hypothetical protein
MVSCIDPDGDSIQLINWGDGSQSTSPVFMETVFIHTTWEKLGIHDYRIRSRQHQCTVHGNSLYLFSECAVIKTIGYLVNTNGEGPFEMFPE